MLTRWWMQLVAATSGMKEVPVVTFASHTMVSFGWAGYLRWPLRADMEWL